MKLYILFVFIMGLTSLHAQNVLPCLGAINGCEICGEYGTSSSEIAQLYLIPNNNNNCVNDYGSHFAFKFENEVFDLTYTDRDIENIEIIQLNQCNYDENNSSDNLSYLIKITCVDSNTLRLELVQNGRSSLIFVKK